jgi:Leucine-rich repeat (LRR) protein
MQVIFTYDGDSEIRYTENNSIHLKKMQYGGVVNIFPRELGTMTNITHLNMDSVDLPGDIGSLKILELQNNFLKYVPPEIGTLNLDANMLTSLPPETLYKLRVHSNDLMSIPHEITNLKKLQVLTLANNSIREIPTGLSRELMDLNLTTLPKLRNLKLTSNRFRTYPSVLYELDPKVRVSMDGLFWRMCV